MLGKTVLFVSLGLVVSCGDDGPEPVADAGLVPDAMQQPDAALSSLDESLRTVLSENNIEEFDIGPDQEPMQVALGQLLYFDREISGNRDVACATCHHPTTGTSDDLSLSIGVGGTGLGATRVLGVGKSFIARNAPEVFNRGAPQWTTMFWDGRIDTEVIDGNPAGSLLPTVLLGNPLAIQAMFPPTARDEMRGDSGDDDINGDPNEIGNIDDADILDIWAGLADRLRVIPEYATLFPLAFDDIDDPSDIGFEHAALAIAAFEVDAFSFDESPFDRYMGGDDTAISDSAKRGALLFYGDANCVGCHTGSLFSDQLYHNVATPQVGPGRGAEAPVDIGRSVVSGSAADDYAFRTPSLRNITESGPWMHNGAYTSLRAVVEHQLDPVSGLMSYDPTQLSVAMQELVLEDDATMDAMIDNLDELVVAATLSSEQVDDLVAFLEALTDPAAVDMSALVPTSVPSGLTVD